MKKNKGLSSSLVVVSFIFSFLGCSVKGSTHKNTIETDNFKIDTSYLVQTRPDTIGCTFKLDMNYPMGGNNQSITDSVTKLFLFDYFGERFSRMAPRQAAKAYMQDYINSYKIDMEQMKSEFEGFSASFNYEEISSSKIRFNENDFFSYTINTYSYTGGAHGIEMSLNHVIWLHDGTRITLKDIIDESANEKVGKLIINRIAKDRNVWPAQNLNEEGFFSIEEVMPTENFYIDNKGITWTYNPYDISAYWIGEVNVTLSWRELSPYINHLSPVMELFRY